MTTIANRLIKGSLWLSLSRALVNALGTISTVILAWYLSPADFGLVALGMTMLAIVTSVTDLSLAEALVRHKDPDESHFSAAWTLGALRGLVLCLLFWAFAYPCARLFDEPRLVGIMVALGVSIFLSGLVNTKRIMLQRDLIFRQEFVLSVSQKLTGFVASVAVAAIYHSYWALIVGQLVTQLTNVIVSFFVLPFRPRILFSHFREFFAFSGWLSAARIINTLNWRFDSLIVGKFLGPTDLGYYSVGSNLAMLPTREAIAPLTQTIFPGFARISGDRDRMAAGYQRAQAMVTAIALPAGIGFAVVADPLIRLALGEIWAPAVFVVQALSAVFALQTLGSLVQPLGMAQGRTRVLFLRDTQMLFIRVPIIVLGMIYFGLAGVVYGRIVSSFINTGINLLLVRQLVGLSITKQLAANLRALIGVVLMAGCVLAVHAGMGHTQDKLALAGQVAVLTTTGAFVYISTSLVLWLCMGRPAGPESETLRVFGRLSARLWRK